jgi:hypothetical protein
MDLDKLLGKIPPGPREDAEAWLQTVDPASPEVVTQLEWLERVTDEFNAETAGEPKLALS